MGAKILWKSERRLFIATVVFGVSLCFIALVSEKLNTTKPASHLGLHARPTVLVLGSGGLVGRSLVAALVANNYTVAEVHNRHDLDLRDAGALEARFGGHHFSFCYFLAFEVGGAKFLAASSVQQAIVSSTTRMYAEVFGFLQNHSIPTMFISTQQVHANTSYGKMKAKGEKVTGTLTAGRSVRLSNVFGPDYSGLKSHIITDAVWGCLLHGHFHVRTDGHEKRQFIHAADLAKALISAMKEFDQLPSVFSITQETFTSIRQVMAWVQAAVGHCNITYGDLPAQLPAVGEHNSSMIYHPANTEYCSVAEGVKLVTQTLSSNVKRWTDTSYEPLMSLLVFGDSATQWSEFVRWRQLWQNATNDLMLEEEVLTPIVPPSPHAFDDACSGGPNATKRIASIALINSSTSTMLNAVAQRAQSDMLVFWHVAIPPTRAIAEFLGHKSLRSNAVYFAQQRAITVPAPRVAREHRASWFAAPNNSVCEGFMIVSKARFLMAGGLPDSNLGLASFALGLAEPHVDRVILDMPFESCRQANLQWSGRSHPSEMHTQLTQPLIQSCTWLNHQPTRQPLPAAQPQTQNVTFITVAVTAETFDLFWALAGSFSRTPQRAFKLLVFHCGLHINDVLSLAHVEGVVVVQSDVEHGTPELWNKRAFNLCTQELLAAFALQTSVAMHGYVMFMSPAYNLNFNDMLPGKPSSTMQQMHDIVAKLHRQGALKYGDASLGMPAALGGYTEHMAGVYHSVPAGHVPGCIIPTSKTAACFTSLRHDMRALNTTWTNTARPATGAQYVRPINESLVCAGVGTYNAPGWAPQDAPLISTLLPSYVQAAALSEAKHRIYIGYDQGDALLDDAQRSPDMIAAIAKLFTNTSSNRLSYKLLRGPHVSQNVDYVWNHVFHQAYLDGCDYFLQLVDDVKLPASRWAEAFAADLAKHNPPNFGVVGSPALGSDGLISQPFVHRTHLEVWGSFYPPVFHNWYGDTWMTFVYLQSGFVTHNKQHVLVNTQVKGTKYNACTCHAYEYELLLKQQKTFVEQVARELRGVP